VLLARGLWWLPGLGREIYQISSIHTRNKCLVCGEVVSLINPLGRVVWRLCQLQLSVMGLSTYKLTTQYSHSSYIHVLSTWRERDRERERERERFIMRDKKVYDYN
jgi:hypothetical protein